MSSFQEQKKWSKQLVFRSPYPLNLRKRLRRRLSNNSIRVKIPYDTTLSPTSTDPSAKLRAKPANLLDLRWPLLANLPQQIKQKSLNPVFSRKLHYHRWLTRSQLSKNSREFSLDQSTTNNDPPSSIISNKNWSASPTHSWRWTWSLLHRKLLSLLPSY